ncbi:MAG: molybdate ABC transporter substrate-binding protein [Acaryochloridaceae cyanobacterium SU_2_1]|nr:molybdate ABC transporter substrate-binding protein [Acaryochloridaceae cyanobacterium SU_2_1]
MKRRQFLPLVFAGLLSCLVVGGCSAGGPLALSKTRTISPVTLTVSAAASLQDVLDAIAPQFQSAHPNIVVDYNFGASGALQRQIEQGAPADIFFAAAKQPMDALSEKGMIVPDTRQDLVTNRLVLIAPETSKLVITEIAQLKTADISRFAVGEFRSVPAGQYAKQVLEALDLLESLKPKFVFGNSVRNVLAAVESGNAEVGMVYATDAAFSKPVKILATAPENTHQPIVYPIAMVQNGSHPEAAQTFIDFLTMEAAQKIFAVFGFGPV